MPNVASENLRVKINAPDAALFFQSLADNPPQVSVLVEMFSLLSFFSKAKQ